MKVFHFDMFYRGHAEMQYYVWTAVYIVLQFELHLNHPGYACYLSQCREHSEGPLD